MSATSWPKSIEFCLAIAVLALEGLWLVPIALLPTKIIVLLARVYLNLRAEGSLRKLLAEVPPKRIGAMPPWVRFRTGHLNPPTSRILPASQLPGPDVFASSQTKAELAQKLRALAVELDGQLAATAHDPELFLVASRELIDDLTQAGHPLFYLGSDQNIWSECFGPYDDPAGLFVDFELKGFTLVSWGDVREGAPESDE